MKKICIIRQGYSDDVRVRKEIRALIDEGHSVDLLCLSRDNEPKNERMNSLEIHRTSMRRTRAGVSNYLQEYIGFFMIALYKVSILHFQKKFDYIQVNTLPDFLVFSTIFPKMFGAKIILDLHEPSTELFGTIFGRERKILIMLIKLFEKLSIWYADHAITVSEPMKRNHIKKGMPESKFSVVLNVPNLEFDSRLYKKKTDRSDKSFVLICHGAMLKRYGQDIAIKAVNIVKEKIPNIRLNILGYGEYESSLKLLTEELQLEKYVNFFGYIPFQDMIKMINEADVGIVPIRRNPYSDLVHTNKMFEYIAMKKPVIISRTSAVEEFYGKDDNCLKYFESGNVNDLANCIIELYENPKKREQMIINAYKIYDKEKWEITKHQYCSIFQ